MPPREHPPLEVVSNVNIDQYLGKWYEIARYPVLGDNYEYAVVSEPKRQYLWILSRKPIMQRLRYEKLLKTLREKHFDVSLK